MACRSLFRSRRSDALTQDDYFLALLGPAVCWRDPAASLLAQSTVFWLKRAAEAPVVTSPCHLYNTRVQRRFVASCLPCATEWTHQRPVNFKLLIQCCPILFAEV
jgi:hypothetical protein